jgi:hypothetical protein
MRCVAYPYVTTKMTRNLFKPDVHADVTHGIQRPATAPTRHGTRTAPRPNDNLNDVT